MTGRALAVCNHPGGARALCPVVERILELRPQISFDVWMTQHGVGIADVPSPRVRAQLRNESIDDDEYATLDLRGYEFVLTATSIGGNLESAVVCRSHDQHVPVFSILDQASEYGRRFRGRGGALTSLPDLLFVPNGMARRELLDLGVSAPRVVVSGNPALDHLPQVRMRFSNHIRQRVLHELGVQDPPGFVLFVSEPISTDHADGTRYSEWSALQFVLTTRHDMPPARRPAVVVKLHPREAPTKFDRLLSDCGDGHVRTAPSFMDRHDLVMASNLVVGIESTLLTEAAVLGVPCCRLQPEEVSSHPARDGEGTVAIRDAAALRDVLERPWRIPGPTVMPRSNASGVVIDAIASFVGDRAMQALPAPDGR